MANDESVLREVDQEIAEDRQWAFFRKHGPAIGAGALAIIVSVAGVQIWSDQKEKTALRNAVAFHEASTLLENNPTEGREALQSFTDDASPGYRVLALMRQASSLATAGERDEALALYRQVYGDGGATSRVKELARIRAGYLALADGRDAVLADIGALADGASVFSPYAREISGVAAINEGDFETAASLFGQIKDDPQSPAPLRQRATEYAALAATAKAGVSISRDIRLEDLTNNLGASTPDVALPDDGSEDAQEPPQTMPEEIDEDEGTPQELAVDANDPDSVNPDAAGSDSDDAADPQRNE